jgi:hypothetical protein
VLGDRRLWRDGKVGEVAQASGSAVKLTAREGTIVEMACL